MGSNPTLSVGVMLDGEVLEWPIRRAWKARVPVKWNRGFESRPLRHIDKNIRFYFKNNVNSFFEVWIRVTVVNP